VWRVYTTHLKLSPQKGTRSTVKSGFCATIGPMKTLTRIVIVAAVAAAIYFSTIGRDQFYGLLDFFNEIIQAIASGYLKK
jgi:hypothetical protein